MGKAELFATYCAVGEFKSQEDQRQRAAHVGPGGTLMYHGCKRN